ncbi:hypothetical protein OEZ85_008575 [Tetradesmus obliquus]|uniref:FMN hydroxy acid dehydrogenase domain-containing protein n=1 Tax=Tetradesmus obliquus TaxID=3088 RepID=A0ABY8TJ82_TETOB|nr:hypothetical protein OEZ85_008575 [Tetradesmus obliquus]
MAQRPQSTSAQQQPFINLVEVEQLAKATLPKMAYDYFAAGAETEQTVGDNRSAFGQYRILPRILVDVSKVSTSCNMFGYSMAMPLLVAPMAMHGLAHSDKELGTARAAAAVNIPMCVSTMANMSLQEVAAQAQHPCMLFQLYVIRDRQIVEGWVRQAEAAGYKALMITVDAPRLGRREADERNRFRLPDHLHMANLQVLAEKRAAGQPGSTALLDARDSSHSSGLFELFAREVDDTLTWEAIPWLRSITKLPIYIKGVLSPADALLALQHGVDGIVVSNHGGRQLDYSPAALDMLPGVVAAVGGRLPVLMDGGIRRGTDVLKALALGASAVLLGRPVIYGLAVGGQQGVQQVLQTIQPRTRSTPSRHSRALKAHKDTQLRQPAWQQHQQQQVAVAAAAACAAPPLAAPGAAQQQAAYPRGSSGVPNPLAGELPHMQAVSAADVHGAARSNASSTSLPLVALEHDEGMLSPNGSLHSSGVRHLTSDDDASLIRDNSVPSHAYGRPEPAPYKPVAGPGSTAHVTVQLAPINTRRVDKDELPQLVHDQDQQQQQQPEDAWQHVTLAADGRGDAAAGGANAGHDDDNASSCAGIVPPGSQQPLPPFWGQLTLRAVLVGLVVGFGFVLLNMRLALVTGLTANLQVVIAGACWALLRCYTALLGRDMACIRTLTAPEVSVAASTALAVSSSAAAAGFGSVLLALQEPVAQRVGSSIPGNLPSLVWQLGYWRLVGYMMMVGLSGALLVLPFRKLLFARPSMTFATGAAAGQLLNALHTPAMSYHGHKQMARFAQWSAISFVFSGYQWVFNHPACNGFRRFPTFGLQALRYTWNFDFALPFVGLGILAPISVAWSMLLGGLLSWGLLWPLLSRMEGTWFPQRLEPWDIRGAYGYYLTVAMALLLSDAAYHMVKGIVGAVLARRIAAGCGKDGAAVVCEEQRTATGRAAVLDELEHAAEAAAAGAGKKRSKGKGKGGKSPWMVEALRIVETDTLSDASSLQFSMAAMERALRQHIFMSDGMRGWHAVLGFLALAAAAAFALPALVSTGAATATTTLSAAQAAAGHLRVYHVLIAGVLAAVAGLANARGAGVTDLNMADAYAKIGMLVFAAWAGQGAGSAGTALACGGLLLGVSTTAVNALYAWRAGFMAMASPTAIFIAHMIGLAASCLLTPAAWMLFDQSAGPAGVMGSVSSSSLLAADGFFASPMAAIFRQTAVLATAGVSALPAHALWVAFSALIVGVALNALRDTLPMQLRGVVPIPAAVGVVFMSGASIAVDLAVGAAARIFWRLRYPRSADAYALVVGCALIAGEGLWGLGKGLLAAFGVQAPICMTFSVPPRV